MYYKHLALSICLLIGCYSRSIGSGLAVGSRLKHMSYFTLFYNAVINNMPPCKWLKYANIMVLVIRRTNLNCKFQSLLMLFKYDNIHSELLNEICTFVEMLIIWNSHIKVSQYG